MTTDDHERPEWTESSFLESLRHKDVLVRLLVAASGKEVPETVTGDLLGWDANYLFIEPKTNRSTVMVSKRAIATVEERRSRGGFA